jgi:hypothetical protein
MYRLFDIFLRLSANEFKERGGLAILIVNVVYAGELIVQMNHFSTSHTLRRRHQALRALNDSFDSA